MLHELPYFSATWAALFSVLHKLPYFQCYMNCLIFSATWTALYLVLHELHYFQCYRNCLVFSARWSAAQGAQPEPVGSGLAARRGQRSQVKGQVKRTIQYNPLYEVKVLENLIFSEWEDEEQRKGKSLGKLSQCKLEAMKEISMKGNSERKGKKSQRKESKRGKKSQWKVRHSGSKERNLN